MKTKRNDPCPCGSGKKYKKCCMNKLDSAYIQDVKDDIHNLISNQNFDSVEELQTVLEQFSQQKNIDPVGDFHGLSAEQMHHFLYMAFDTPELVSFPLELQEEPNSKAAFLLTLLLEGIGEDGMKLTTKGNLNQKFCQEARKKYFSQYPDPVMFQFSVRTETDFEPLHTIRLTAQLSGLVRKYKGKLLLTQKCSKGMDKGGNKTLFPLLLHSYIDKFNWAYRDGYQELPFIQRSFLFSLYLLHKYGGSWQPDTFYSNIFLTAFPAVTGELKPDLYEPPEATLHRCYILRTLRRFLEFFGLADLELISDQPINREYRIRSTDLFGEIVQWHL